MPQKFQDQVFSDLADKLASNIVNTLVPVKVAMSKGDTVYLARAGLTKDARCEIVELGEPIPIPMIHLSFLDIWKKALRL